MEPSPELAVRLAAALDVDAVAFFDLLPCPCGCEVLTSGGRYVNGHQNRAPEAREFFGTIAREFLATPEGQAHLALLAGRAKEQTRCAKISASLIEWWAAATDEERRARVESMHEWWDDPATEAARAALAAALSERSHEWWADPENAQIRGEYAVRWRSYWHKTGGPPIDALFELARKGKLPIPIPASTRQTIGRRWGWATLSDETRRQKGLAEALDVSRDAIERVERLGGVHQLTPDRCRAIIEGLMRTYRGPASLELDDGSRRRRDDPVYRREREKIMTRLRRGLRELGAPELEALLT